MNKCGAGFHHKDNIYIDLSDYYYCYFRILCDVSHYWNGIFPFDWMPMAKGFNSVSVILHRLWADERQNEWKKNGVQ